MREINNHKNHDEMIALKFQLSQNYPDPFKDKTRIKYCIAYKTRVSLTIFNLKDKFVKKIFDKEHEAGAFEIEFDAGCLADGTYFYKLQAGDNIYSKKMMVKK